jgi:ribosome-associated protein
MMLYILLFLLLIDTSVCYVSNNLLKSSCLFEIGGLWAKVPPGTPPRNRSPSKRDRMLNSIIEKSNFERVISLPQQQLEDDPELPVVVTAIKSADQRKAGNIMAMKISHMTEVTTFMIICEGTSKPQNQAIANAVEDALWKEHSRAPVTKDGGAGTGWMVMDYGSIIVHIMTPTMRDFYKLERRWNDAEKLDLSEILFNDPYDSFEKENDNEKDNEKDEGDPFWS